MSNPWGFLLYKISFYPCQACWRNPRSLISTHHSFSLIATSEVPIPYLMKIAEYDTCNRHNTTLQITPKIPHILSCQGQYNAVFCIHVNIYRLRQIVFILQNHVINGPNQTVVAGFQHPHIRVPMSQLQLWKLKQHCKCHPPS